MHDDISRNGSGAGYGAADRPDPLAGRPAARPAVPPFEAAWLRAVGCSGRLGGAGLDRVATPLASRPGRSPKPSR